MNDTPKTWPVMSIARAHTLLTAPGSRFEMEDVIIRGIKTRVWKNLPPTLREILLMARSYGEREFLVYEDERVSFEDFARASLAIAAELQSQGVVKGDRVAIIMRNIPEWAAVFMGAAVIGAIVTPLNAWWTGPELEYGLVDSGAKVAFVDAERLERFSEHLAHCPELKRVYVSRCADELLHPIVHRLEDVTGKVNDWGKLPAGQLPDVTIGPDDDATILYTSGTTGKPKGALGTHRNMLSNIMAAGLSMARNFLRRGEPVPMIDLHAAPQRVGLLSIPLFHATGCFAVMGPALFAGSKIVLMRKWEPELAMQVIEREKVHQVGGVPTIAWQLLEHPARAKYDLSSLETVAYGGAPSAPELVRKIQAAQFIAHFAVAIGASMPLAANHVEQLGVAGAMPNRRPQPGWRPEIPKKWPSRLNLYILSRTDLPLSYKVRSQADGSDLSWLYHKFPYLFQKLIMFLILFLIMCL